MMSLTVTRMYGKQQQAAIPSQLSSLTSSNQSAARWVTGQQVCQPEAIHTCVPCRHTHVTRPVILSV